MRNVYFDLTRECNAAQPRREIVSALALELDELQERYRKRLRAYAEAGREYWLRARTVAASAQPLLAPHAELVNIAEKHLPLTPEEPDDVDAE